MEFLQQNKAFAIVVGLALVALVVLWPSLFGLGPTIVSLDRSAYDRAKMSERSRQGKFDQYFPKSGKGIPIKRAVQDTDTANSTLSSNLDELTAWMAFVPRFPFRIPETRTTDVGRRSYVSRVYTYALSGEIEVPECTIKDPADGLVWLAGTRSMRLLDKVFGMSELSTPGAIKDPDIRIMQIALVHELGHLAIRLNVDEITSIVPSEPYPVRLGGAEVATAYPVNVRARCDLPTLMALLHALDGAHGRVAKASGGEEPADAIKPLAPPPKPKPAEPAAGEPDDPDPGPARAEAAPQQKLVIHLTGCPSYLSPDASQGALKERFTIFRRDTANPQKLLFAANATATKVLDPGTPKLTPDSVLNWRALCSKLRNQSPLGKHLWQLLSLAVQKAVEEVSDGKDPGDDHKSAILGSLNEILGSERDLCRPENLAGLTLGSEADALLKLDRKTLPAERLMKLNRMLLEAAYPLEIARICIKLEAIAEPYSDQCVQPDDKPPVRNVVREGDLASTRYFFVRSLKVKSIPGTITRDTQGFPSEVTPPHLEVDLAVAALRFPEVQAAAAPAEKRPTGTDSTILPRGF